MNRTVEIARANGHRSVEPSDVAEALEDFLTAEVRRNVLEIIGELAEMQTHDPAGLARAALEGGPL